MTDFVQQAKDILAGFKAEPPAPKQRALTADEQKQVDAFTARLTAPPPDTGKEGFDHWLKSPHGAADVFAPHFVPVPVDDPEKDETLGDA